MAAPALVVIVVGVWFAVRFVRPAPPTAIKFIGGAEGSSYRSTAEKYKKLIEAYGVKVEILPSRGALDTLQQLANPASKGDVGMVQGGLVDGIDLTHLMSLGTVFAQPLMIYYRSAEPVEILSQLKGKRLAVGPQGSGTRALALKLLKANDIEGAPTTFVDLGGEEAARALVDGSIDAAFLMGDSATPKIMRSLRAAAGIDVMSFRQAEGYLRKFRFLTRLTLPEGTYDLGKNYPPKTLNLIGPTVELVARNDLHPAVSDLLIGAARQVHGGAGMFRNAGEFPSPAEREFTISPDAERYYRSGGQFLYKRLPFWLASLVDRLLVVLLPLLVLIVPATKIAPGLYRWRVRSRIYRWYGALMAIERDMLAHPTPETHAQILKRLDEIEQSVNEIKTPLSFADQLYVLRDHVGMVRRRLLAGSAAAA
ncbi:MAG: ABC transporter substrate-binding protein [Deltaproteobacteria bacterium]|nr:ABC transporter substrate-binding protein [Deltaproteobacteria bacterium]